MKPQNSSFTGFFPLWHSHLSIFIHKNMEKLQKKPFCQTFYAQQQTQPAQPFFFKKPQPKPTQPQPYQTGPKSVIPVSHQLEYFKEYKEKLKMAKGESLANEIIAEALYLFSIGTNDFILNYLVLPVRQAQYTAPEYVTYLIGLANAAIRDLYDLGARKIAFAGLGPFGCIPSARMLNHDESGECNEEYNQLARRFNAELKDALRKLNGDLAGLKVVYAETYSAVASIIANPSKYGFENAVQGCCGTGLIETSVLCGIDQAFTCQDANRYVFFDSVHPSEGIYKIAAHEILNTALQVFL